MAPEPAERLEIPRVWHAEAPPREARTSSQLAWGTRAGKLRNCKRQRRAWRLNLAVGDWVSKRDRIKCGAALATMRGRVLWPASPAFTDPFHCLVQGVSRMMCVALVAACHWKVVSAAGDTWDDSVDDVGDASWYGRFLSEAPPGQSGPTNGKWQTHLPLPLQSFGQVPTAQSRPV